MGGGGKRKPDVSFDAYYRQASVPRTANHFSAFRLSFLLLSSLLFSSFFPPPLLLLEFNQSGRYTKRTHLTITPRFLRNRTDITRREISQVDRIHNYIHKCNKISYHRQVNISTRPSLDKLSRLRVDSDSLINSTNQIFDKNVINSRINYSIKIVLLSSNSLYRIIPKIFSSFSWNDIFFFFFFPTKILTTSLSSLPDNQTFRAKPHQSFSFPVQSRESRITIPK